MQHHCLGKECFVFVFTCLVVMYKSCPFYFIYLKLNSFIVGYVVLDSITKPFLVCETPSRFSNSVLVTGCEFCQARYSSRSLLARLRSIRCGIMPRCHIYKLYSPLPRPLDFHGNTVLLFTCVLVRIQSVRYTKNILL